MSYFRTCFLLFFALPVISAPALAQNQNQNKNQNQNQTQKPAVVQQKPAVVQQKPAASQQLNYANQGAAQRNHVFDGTKPPNTPVQANTGPKPNLSGQSAGIMRPQQHLHTNPVPSPTVTRPTTAAATTPVVVRSTTTTPTVTRTTTPTVVRSSTTTTTPAKKP